MNDHAFASPRRGQAASLVPLLVAAVSGALLFAPRPSPPTARAGVPLASTVFFVPASAHASGANGTNWRTDVEVHNPGAAAVSFTIQLLKRDADNGSVVSKSYTLAALRSRRFVDVLASEFDFEGAAALRIASSSAVVVTSRTYNAVGPNPWNLPEGASFGQFVPGIAGSEAIGAGQEGRLIQLTQQAAETRDGFRTNLGIVNTTAIPIDVRVDLYRADGSWLGKKDGTETNLPAYGFRQLNEAFGAYGAVPDGYAIVRTTTAGGGLLAFATVIDNHSSGDPIFVPAARVASAGTSPTPTATATPAPTPTPSPGGRPNLFLYRPSGWTACLSASSRTGCCSGTACCAVSPVSGATTYLQFFVANGGQATLVGPVRFSVALDAAVVGYASWSNSSNLEPGFGVILTWELGDLVLPGTHSLRLTVDPENVIAESNEGDNVCAISATWEGAPLLGAGPIPDPSALSRIREGPRLPLSGETGAGLSMARPVALLAAPAATAGSAIYVPASAHASGVNGASWRTDLEVHNPGTTAVTFAVDLLRPSTDNGGSVPTRTFSLGPQQSVRYVDVLSSVFGTDGAAALRVTPQSGALLVNSRTYNLIGANAAGLPVGASFGQYVPGIAESDALGDADEGRIVQLSHRDASSLTGSRTNAGFVNTTGSAIDLRVDLMDAAGGLLGTIQDDRTHLRAYEFKQINALFGEFSSAVPDGHVIVRTMSAGGRFLAFATVIDNHLTGDPVFVPAAKVARSALPTPTPTPTGTVTPTPTPAAAVTVTVSPAAVTLQAGGRQTFKATVSGTANSGVTWKVAEGAAGGTIDGQGGYAAPAAPGVYTIVAASQADPTATGVAYVMVATRLPDAAFAPKPTVTGTTTAESRTITTTPNVAAEVSLSDGTKVEVPALPGAVTVTLARETNTLAADVAAGGQETTGSMRTLTVSGDSASLDFVPLITIPAAEAGSLETLNAARVGTTFRDGEQKEGVLTFLPVERDAAGNALVRDVLLRGAGKALAPSAPAPLAAKSVKASVSLSTYQHDINWAIEPQLVRMVPTTGSPKRVPLSTLPRAEQDEILRRPVQNVLVLVHGHNEAERYGFEKAVAGPPWLQDYKRDVWTLLYDAFQLYDKDYLGCTAFYEYVYPSYRPVFDGKGEHLGASLARMIAEDPRLKKLAAKYNLFFVAHSMGGLVVRSAVNQLAASVEPNFEKLVTWGTPHRGSPVVTLRYILTAGYTLQVRDMCVTGAWLPLETLNDWAFYRGWVNGLAVDTPGERDLRWDGSRALNLEASGWITTPSQRTSPDVNPMLYGTALLAFNQADKHHNTDRYVALYGITSKLARIDMTSCSSLVTFKRADQISQGNGIAHWVYNNEATIGGLYAGSTSVRESDGAVTFEGMVGYGVFKPDLAYSLQDTDHEEYYGAPVNGAMKEEAKAKGDRTATWTLDLLKIRTDPAKKCDCPTLTVDQAAASGSAAQVAATLKWPGDAKPGQRVQGVASARGEGEARVVTPAMTFDAQDDGTITATFAAAAVTQADSQDKVLLLAQLKDGSEVGAPIVLPASGIAKTKYFTARWWTTTYLKHTPGGDLYSCGPTPQLSSCPTFSDGNRYVPGAGTLRWTGRSFSITYAATTTPPGGGSDQGRYEVTASGTVDPSETKLVALTVLGKWTCAESFCHYGDVNQWGYTFKDVPLAYAYSFGVSGAAVGSHVSGILYSWSGTGWSYAYDHAEWIPGAFLEVTFGE